MIEKFFVSDFDKIQNMKFFWPKAKNTGHLEWNLLGDFSEFKTNGDSKEAL